jgi:1,2-dihydroxy-3-keto-5-methylthiopentene dioxygenase
MAILKVPDEGRTLTDPNEISEYLFSIGVGYERWPVVEIDPPASQDAILGAYSERIGRLMRDEGYVSSDVVEVTPDIPGLEAMLGKFRREHWHDEDEVRFIVDGRGLFHISPDNGAAVVSIEVEAGDLIRIPAGTLHWFDVCGERRITAIRLFSDRAGWTPHYSGSGIDGKYLSVCLDIPLSTV